MYPFKVIFYPKPIRKSVKKIITKCRKAFPHKWWLLHPITAYATIRYGDFSLMRKIKLPLKRLLFLITNFHVFSISPSNYGLRHQLYDNFKFLLKRPLITLQGKLLFLLEVQLIEIFGEDFCTIFQEIDEIIVNFRQTMCMSYHPRILSVYSQPLL